jgi:hypothetical protein
MMQRDPRLGRCARRAPHDNRAGALNPHGLLCPFGLDPIARHACRGACPRLQLALRRLKPRGRR